MSTDAQIARSLRDNRDLWDKRVRAHLQHGLYPSGRVLDGTYDVLEPEITELGDVRGKRLVHLQCNAGADTLAWARRGALVTGIDFSSVAIDEARRLASSTGVDATFVCADVLAPPEGLGPFDLVYTSMGVLWWLPDLDRWAGVIHDLLADGGVFYIHEIHPMTMCLLERDDGTIALAEDYYDSPPAFETTGTYYDGGSDFAAEPATEHGTVHTLGQVVTAIAGAGLRIEWLHEHPFTTFRQHPSMVWDDERRLWGWPRGAPRIPVTFSLRARR